MKTDFPPANRLTDLQIHGKPLDWHQTYLSRVLELTPDDLRSVAAEYLGMVFTGSEKLSEKTSPTNPRTELYQEQFAVISTLSSVVFA